MSEKIQALQFEVVEKELTNVVLVLPFGEFEFNIDLADTTIADRLADLIAIYKDKDNFVQEPNGTIEQAEQALSVLNKIKNATDYVYNTNVCAEIYKHIEPLQKIKVNGEETVFSLFILNNIQERINQILKAKGIENAKKDMQAFVNSHA